jgi:hypothetical protein
MIISDLNYLEVTSEASSVVGGGKGKGKDEEKKKGKGHGNNRDGKKRGYSSFKANVSVLNQEANAVAIGEKAIAVAVNTADIDQSIN